MAKKLAQEHNVQGIQEIASHLWDKNQNIQSDCLKVLYEIGYLAPELISDYTEDFLKLTQNKNNRLVWGAMIALSRAAALNPAPCIEHLVELKEIIEKGSVITQDNGIKTLAALAASADEYQVRIFPFLLEHLRSCGDKYVAQRAESIFVAVNKSNKADYLLTLSERLSGLTESQSKRVCKLIRSLG